MTRHEREQRRVATAGPDPPGLLEQAAADGKTVCGVARADASQVHLLSVLDVLTSCVRAQREIDAKTNEMPELATAIAHLALVGAVVTLAALHTQAERNCQYLWIKIFNRIRQGLVVVVVSLRACPGRASASISLRNAGWTRRLTWTSELAGGRGVNAHMKIACLAAGMIAGADSIDDMGLLRHGAMPAVWRDPGPIHAGIVPARPFTWRNVLQLGGRQ